MKKLLCIGILMLFFALIFLPIVSANVLNFSRLQENSKNNSKKSISSWLEDRCKHINEDVPQNERLLIETTNDPPRWFDWRYYNGKNWMTSVKNQGACGSCTAFAINAAIEAKINIQNNNPNIDRDLSEAHIYFCTDHDCLSGSTFSSLANYVQNVGICDELSFPYDKAGLGNSLNCDLSNSWKCNGVSIKGHRYLDSDRDNIKNALIQYGPLPASMTAYLDFEFYIGGVYDDPVGDPVSTHAVCIVGYNDEERYWICKNSWGKLWGEEGYFRIRYGICDIEEDVKIIKDIYDLNPGTPYIPERPSGDLVVRRYFYGDYETETRDPNNDRIRYLWDWDGDFNVDYESDFLNSGGTCKTVNNWNNEGMYEIRVRAEDTNGLKSDWSRPLIVTVSKSRERDKHSIFELLLEKWNFFNLIQIT